MSEQLGFWKGNLEPSIEDQLTTTDDLGVTTGVDLSTATASFRMREVGSDVLKIDRAVSFKDSDGFWRYDWQGTDTDTPGQFLAWLHVVRSGKPQDVSEFLIRIFDHVPIVHGYLEPEQWKASLEMTDQTYADQDIYFAIESASRVVDFLSGRRRFWPDDDALQVRFYTPDEESGDLLIDDLLELTSVETAPGSDGLFSQTWTLDTDFRLAPYDAEAEGRPWRRIEVMPGCRYRFPCYPHSVKVTGRFGWERPPANIVQATSIIATQLLKRVREAPWGVVGLGVDGMVARINRSDPDLVRLLQPYTRKRRMGLA